MSGGYFERERAGRKKKVMYRHILCWVSCSLKLAGIKILFGQCDNWFHLQLKNRSNFKDTLTFSPTSSFRVRLDNTESANTTIVKLLWAKKLIKVR